MKEEEKNKGFGAADAKKAAKPAAAAAQQQQQQQQQLGKKASPAGATLWKGELLRERWRLAGCRQSTKRCPSCAQGSLAQVVPPRACLCRAATAAAAAGQAVAAGAGRAGGVGCLG